MTAEPQTVDRYLRSDLLRTLFGETMLENTLVGIALVMEHRIVWVNDTFARMLGYDRKELIGQSPGMLYPDGPGFELFGVAANPVLKSGQPYVTEQRFKRKDGTLIW